MGITRVSRMRDCGVFRDFTWPGDLPDFGRYNLIYGWNGSGKTTLSRVFRALETRTPPSLGQVSLNIGAHDVQGNAFGEQSILVRVFNRDFVADSVFPVGGGDVAPIFVVGKESVDKQKEVDRLKADQAQRQTRLDSERRKQRDAEKAFDNFCIARATVIRDTLRSPGPNRYNDYDKSDFRRRAERMLADGDKDSHRLSESDRERLLAQSRGSQKTKLEELAYRLPAPERVADAVSELLSATVASTPIPSLKDDPALSAWLHEGLSLHDGRRAEMCLFCDQALPGDRLSKLKAHFSSEYEQLLTNLNGRIVEVEEMRRNAANVVTPNHAEVYEDLASEFEVAELALRNSLDTTKTFLDSLIVKLKDKKTRAFATLSLDVALPDLEPKAVASVNDVIRRHNEACDGFQVRLSQARQRLEADSVARDLDELRRLENARQASQASVDGGKAEVERLRVDIARLEREIVEHRQPAEDLTEDLRKYLGHDELRLEIKDTGYTITRNGTAARTLSEGETTAIALLYFLKSLEDRRFDLTKGVVVLDDPVSSLDDNALYLAFGFMRERAQHAAQIFILTHNFRLFRQVRNWFHHLKGQRKPNISQRPARFYMVECVLVGGKRYSSIGPLDPLLERYESEYHYLFARVYRAASVTPSVALDDSYVLPNLARRLVEAFLAFRQPHIAGELWEKFKTVKFDEAKKLRILRFLHTHSHSDVIDEPEHDPSLLGEARAVLTDLLDLIKSQDPEHFSAMEKVVAPPHAEEGEE